MTGIENGRNIWKTLVRSGDGRSVLAWWVAFATLMLRSIAESGFALAQLKYLFFALVALLLFLRFRVSSTQPAHETNRWGLVGTTVFGLFILFMEFYK